MDDNTQKAFGEQVRLQRKAQKLSQQALAAIVGISRNYLSEIERGTSVNLSWQVREQIIVRLGLARDPSPDPGALPLGLAEFAAIAKLPEEDVNMLAGLKYRGQQPTTPEKGELLYNMIKMAVAAK
jgi:transcriptional regulator with XRE-family HTH domain